MTKIILYFQAATLRSKAWRDKLAGVYQYASKARWQVQLVQSGAKTEEISYMLEAWKPLGCIVDRSLSTARNPTSVFMGIPVVLMDQNPKTASGDYSNVNHDSAASAQLAAEALLSTGVADFSYVPHRLKTHWNREREKALANAVRKRHRRFIPWGETPFLRSLTSSQQDRQIAQRLMTLPRPCGLLCANDQIAQRVVRVAQSINIEIPRDLVIVGIDNDELICEHNAPTITSVQPDFRQGGYLAAELLDARIRNPNAPVVTARYGPLEIIRRQSTQRREYKNRLVERAMSVITGHAFDPDFHTDAILTELNCSRSLLELRFHKELGHSIRKEVQNLRFERALSLLRNPNQTITSIPSLCGYASEPFFKRLFKRETGLTMREWRKQNASTA